MSKIHLCGYVDPELAERVRRAAYWDRQSVSQFIAEALEAYLVTRETARGSPYPDHRGRIRPGRRPDAD